MPLNVTPLITQLITELESAVPALTTTFEAEYLSTVAWKTLTLPVGVVVVEGFRRVNEWGLTNLSYEVLVDLWVVKEITGASAGLRTDLEAVAARFWPTDPLLSAGVARRLDLPEWGYSDALPANAMLRAANRAQRGGYVRLRCLVQVGN